jgi:nucleotide-binding universal stress UspA family protein
MTYRTILLDLTADELVEARLDVARSLASRFGAALIGMHVSPPPLQLAAWQGGMSVYIPPEVAEVQREAARKAKERVRAAFDRARGDDLTAEWREAEGDPGQFLAEAAHAADLVVTAGGCGSPDVAERLVMATGVPVLALPPGAARDLGRVVLVAWKGSPEAARAAHDALPFLRTAERVVLCAVGERSAAGLDAAAAMLGRHQVPVRPERVDGTDAGAGAVLLAQAAAHGADLLVMGAYGHARVRELVFGGATRRVLCDATLPVLFSG